MYDRRAERIGKRHDFIVRALEAGGELGRPLEDILRVFLHLHCIRLLGLDRDAEALALGLLLRTREALDRAPIAAPLATPAP